MSKDDPSNEADNKAAYKRTLRELQIELVKIQRRVIKHDHRILILLEGRDAAGKDGVIKRITEHLSPRETRTIALGKPSDREVRSWYFQRYAHYLPANGEIALFNRSWYNRGGVERVMGFATDKQIKTFYETVGAFEKMLVDDGFQVLKIYLDISKKEQTRRLKARDQSPLKQWKVSPIDAVAIEKWDDYTIARNEMLLRTDFDYAPWHIVKTDNKRLARVNTIRHILGSIDCPETNKALAVPDPEIVLASAEIDIEDLRS